jgi:riboflavin-specific deaminase-like protein
LRSKPKTKKKNCEVRHPSFNIRHSKPPYVLVNVAMTADGKIALRDRPGSTFTSERDKEHMLELRATVDAVMSGARTVDLAAITMSAGPAKYRRLRRRRGLAEQNLRVVVSRRATVDPGAELFRHRTSPIIVLTTELAGKPRLKRLRAVADDVHVCSRKEIDFAKALAWLRSEWGVKRLLCEGGGELNDALFRAGLVDELHLTICPVIFGGRTAPTLSDGTGIERLVDAAQFQLKSMKRIGSELFTVYVRAPRVVPQTHIGHAPAMATSL